MGRQAAAVVAAVAEVPQQSAYSEQHTRLLFILHGGIGFGCCLRRLPPRRAEGALGAACHPARAQERGAIAATRPECDRTPVHRDHMRPLPSRHPASSSRPQLPGCNEARQSSPAVPHVANCYKPRYGSIKQRGVGESWPVADIRGASGAKRMEIDAGRAMKEGGRMFRHVSMSGVGLSA